MSVCAKSALRRIVSISTDRSSRQLISSRWICALLIFFCVVIGSSTAPACTFPQVPDGYGNCVPLCPSGQVALPDTGTCVGAGVTCAANQKISPLGFLCCPSGQQPALLNTPGGSVFTGSCCPPGQAAQSNGSCLPELGPRLIKSTIRERRRDKQRRDNFAPICRSGLRCA
jgi:hypothetical protein